MRASAHVPLGSVRIGRVHRVELLKKRRPQSENQHPELRATRESNASRDHHRLCRSGCRQSDRTCRDRRSHRARRSDPWRIAADCNGCRRSCREARRQWDAPARTFTQVTWSTWSGRCEVDCLICVTEGTQRGSVGRSVPTGRLGVGSVGGGSVGRY